MVRREIDLEKEMEIIEMNKEVLSYHVVWTLRTGGGSIEVERLGQRLADQYERARKIRSKLGETVETTQPGLG